MRGWRWLGLVTALALIVGLGWLKPWQAWRPIRHVRVQGVFAHIDRAAVEKVLLPVVSTGFLNIDLARVERAILRLPWVRAANVRRVWPDTIDIRLYEQVPVARWYDRALLNERGQLFTPEQLDGFRHLPLLTAPPEQTRASLQTLLKIQERLADRKMLLEAFHVSARRAWRLQVSEQLEIVLGTREPERRLDELLAALTLFSAEQITAMARIDMRYPNGFAVVWRPEAPVFDWRKIAERPSSILKILQKSNNHG